MIRDNSIPRTDFVYKTHDCGMIKILSTKLISLNELSGYCDKLLILGFQNRKIEIAHDIFPILFRYFLSLEFFEMMKTIRFPNIQNFISFP